ncbi:MAG: caspase family protein, partial [Pseudomonadota bacterium]
FEMQWENGDALSFSATNFSENKVFGFLNRLVPHGPAGAATPFTPPQPVADVAPIAPPRNGLATAEGGRKVAIVIGVNRFDDPELEDLAFAKNDATALHNLLQGETGEPFDQVTLITGGSHADALTTIDEVANTTRRDDLLMVYYAGHGLVRNQRLHLAFPDTRATLVQSTAMKYANLRDVVEGAQARARLVILDCCYAGAVGEDAPRSALGEQMRQELGSASRTLVLTSATSTQVAREAPDYGHGVFTKHLLDGLRGEADRGGDGEVDTRELFDFLEDRMLAEDLQKPQKFNFSGVRPVALRKTGQHPHRERARDLARQVSALYHEEEALTRAQRDSLFALLDKDLTQMSPLERDRFRLLETHLAGDFRVGRFFDAWEAMAAGHPPPRTPAKAPGRNRPETAGASERFGRMIGRAAGAATAAAKPKDSKGHGQTRTSATQATGAVTNGGTRTGPWHADTRVKTRPRPSRVRKFLRLVLYLVGLGIMGFLALVVLSNL